MMTRWKTSRATSSRRADLLRQIYSALASPVSSPAARRHRLGSEPPLSSRLAGLLACGSSAPSPLPPPLLPRLAGLLACGSSAPSRLEPPLSSRLAGLLACGSSAPSRLEPPLSSRLAPSSLSSKDHVLGRQE